MDCPLISIINIIICLLIVVAVAWIMRQTGFNSQHKWAWGFRLSMLLFAVPYGLKVIERTYGGSTASWIDNCRDFGLLLLLVCVIGFHRDRFGKL